MWRVLVAASSFCIWALTSVQCSDMKCKPVAVLDDVTLDCVQQTSSPDRFVLWYYSNDSNSGYESASSCYFNSSCNVTDQRRYTLEDRSKGTLAKTHLTIKNVDANHNGWAYQCYVWDADEDIMYLSEEYRLLVYKAPRKKLNCAYKRKDEEEVVDVKCVVEGVSPQNISCHVHCQSGEHFSLDARVQTSETGYDVACRGSIRITSQSDWCNITVLARDDLGDCDHVLAAISDSFTNPGKSNTAFWKEGGDVPQDGTNTNVYFTYIISGVVAALVIPLSIWTLCLVLRKRRQNSVPSIQFPIYTQVSTSRELISAHSDTHSCENSWETTWESSGSLSGEAASGMYNIADSMRGVAKSPQSQDALRTLPFIMAAGDTVDNVASGEFTDFAPLPAPHRHQQTSPLTDHNDDCNRPSHIIDENIRFEKRHLKDPQLRCPKPRPLTKFSENKPPSGIVKLGSECEDTKLKKPRGEAYVCDSCKYDDKINSNSRAFGCGRVREHDVYKSGRDVGNFGYDPSHFSDRRDRSRGNMVCSGRSHRHVHDGVGEGACSPQFDYVCNRSFCGTRCAPSAPCRGCHISDQCIECDGKHYEHWRFYHRQHQHVGQLRVNEEARHNRRIDSTRHPRSDDNHQVQDDDECQEHYIEPCSSAASSARSSRREGSGDSTVNRYEDDEQRTLLVHSHAHEGNNS